MSGTEIDYRERLYKLFLEDMKFVNDSGLIRTRVSRIPSEYKEALNPLLAAASLYGTARRIGLVVEPYERNCEEEITLRKALRGRTHNSVVNEISNMPMEEVERELEDYGIDKQKINDLAERMRALVGGPRDEDEDDDVPYDSEPKLPKDAHQVTRIEALYKITRPDGLEQCVTYCRIHTKAAGTEETAIAWSSASRFDDGPEYDFDMVFELEEVHNEATYRKFLGTLAGFALWTKNGPHSDADREGLVYLLDMEADGKETAGQ